MHAHIRQMIVVIKCGWEWLRNTRLARVWRASNRRCGISIGEEEGGGNRMVPPVIRLSLCKPTYDDARLRVHAHADAGTFSQHAVSSFVSPHSGCG